MHGSPLSTNLQPARTPPQRCERSPARRAPVADGIGICIGRGGIASSRRPRCARVPARLLVAAALLPDRCDCQAPGAPAERRGAGEPGTVVAHPWLTLIANWLALGRGRGEILRRSGGISAGTEMMDQFRPDHGERDYPKRVRQTAPLLAHLVVAELAVIAASRRRAPRARRSATIHRTAAPRHLIGLDQPLVAGCAQLRADRPWCPGQVHRHEDTDPDEDQPPMAGRSATAVRRPNPIPRTSSVTRWRTLMSASS